VAHSGTKEPLDFGLLVIRPEVQVQPVLGMFGLRHWNEYQQAADLLMGGSRTPQASH
jgi:hypothetical protein